jgi:hypothetical protein
MKDACKKIILTIPVIFELGMIWAVVSWVQGIIGSHHAE